MGDSDSDEENPIKYGTPLDPIEEDELPSKRKYQEPADQYAVDAHGRRRFHGAFTGGFSAGFGNTVGTPEGWTPSAFKSSRAEKAERSAQRPEDFMDDEDRSEFGIAPRHMQTHSDFSGQKRKLQRFHDGPIPGEPVLEQLLRPIHETAAVRMLRAMGWRPGQGAGDRVTKDNKKRTKEQHKVYGCYMPSELKQNKEAKSDTDSSDSEFEYETLFAPDDYEPYILRRKDDRFGLGYSGLSRHSVLGSMTGEYGAGDSKSHLLMKEKGKKVSIRGQAFGVGAFEAEDEDIYGTEDMSHYDFAIGGASGDKQKKTNKQQGPNVLEGFVKASKPLPAPPAHAAPALPRGYVPTAAGGRRTRFEPTTEPARDQGLGRHELTAEARGNLLGESPVPRVPENPEPTPQTSKDPIAQLLGRNVNFVTTNESKDFISIKYTGREISKTFRPFMSDPEKQTRYERYLKDKEGFMLEEDRERGALKEWERNREMVEFEQAAKLYKPLTGIMGDRFTHASEPDEALNALSAVARSSTNHGLATPEQIEAAKTGLYGVMTRTEARWRPEPLVCKRFNVPDPGGSRVEAKKEDKPKVSYSIFSYLESSVHDKDSFTKEQSKFSGSKSLNTNVPKPSSSKTEENKTEVQTFFEPAPTSLESTGFNKRITVAELFLKESEKDMKSKETVVTETIEKFDKMDLYKSIFLSDSENEEEKPAENKSQDIDVDFVEKPKNTERNLSPPRGIFANIDFDEINSWRRNIESDKPQKDEVKKDSTNETGKEKPVTNNPGEMDGEVYVYGPKIPENLKARLEVPEETFRPIYKKVVKDNDVQEINSSSSSDSWVDAKEVKSKKHKKKKKKHKAKHKKSKHKKKDR